MYSQHRGLAAVGAGLAAFILGSTMLGSTAGASPAKTAVQQASVLAAKKKSKKGTLKITVSGTGSYTVTGKGFRKTGSASKSFKVKPGSYTIKAPSGSVKPARVMVLKGKVSQVKVTFEATVTPTPVPTVTPPATPTPVPTVTPPVTPTPTPTPTPGGALGPVERVSTDSASAQADKQSSDPDWSPDGTRIAFSSDADNLVPSDTNNAPDVFVKTLATGATQRISTDSSGGEVLYWSRDPAWSPDGTKIAFASNAPNLVAGDTNGVPDVFVKTLATGAVQRVSTNALGNQANGDSWDDRGFSLSWSPDGTAIAFVSLATNLVAGDTNNASDVFVKTLASGAIQRVSTDAAGNQAYNAGPDSDSVGPQWSPDGKNIAFSSRAGNLVPGDSAGFDIFVKNLDTGAIQLVSRDSAGVRSNGESEQPVWSPDGLKIAFQSNGSNLIASDTNDAEDVFVKTLSSGAITCASTNADGSLADGGSYPRWSADGTRISFVGYWDNFSGYNVFVKTLSDGRIQPASSDAVGNQAIGDSLYPAPWSPNANKLAFPSFATNLVSGDTNGVQDIFVKTLQ